MEMNVADLSIMAREMIGKPPLHSALSPLVRSTCGCPRITERT